MCRYICSAAIFLLASYTTGISAQPSPWQAYSEREKQEILESRRSARLEYQDYFYEAYSTFPQIPSGILEAVAYVRSGWVHLTPGSEENTHHGMPSAHGVMGLYGGGGFADHLGEAARLLGFRSDEIASDSRLNILGAAALLVQGIDRHESSIATAEEMVPVLAAFAGYGSWMAGEPVEPVEYYPNASFAYVVLLTVERGVMQDGVVVPTHPVEWGKAFDPHMLQVLQSPVIRVTADTTAMPLANCPGGDTDYPDTTLWCPADSSNMTSGRTQQIRSVTIHTMQGYYEGSINWFQDPQANVSAHYLIRRADGQVAQMVRDADTAWHVKGHNSYAIGIEHEGFVDTGDEWYTEVVYAASAQLTRWLCSNYGGVECFRVYQGPSDFGCNNTDYVGEDVLIKGHQMYSGNSNRCDPGIHWDWGYYAELVSDEDGGGGNPPDPDAPCL